MGFVNAAWGGRRINTGGARANSGGLRAGAGRKPTVIVPPTDISEVRWFMYRTWPGAERQSARDLSRQGWTNFLPMVEEYRVDPVVTTMRHIVEMLYWPGYGCVEFDRTSRVWPTILSCDGVRAIMGDRWGRPSPVARGWIEKIQSETDSRRIVRNVILPPIEVGTEMIVTEGAFTDHAGICIWSSQKRVRIMAAMFGGMREITIDRTDIRAVT